MPVCAPRWPVRASTSSCSASPRDRNSARPSSAHCASFLLPLLHLRFPHFPVFCLRSESVGLGAAGGALTMASPSVDLLLLVRAVAQLSLEDAAINALTAAEP